ncbi:MAG: glycosyltransferase [Patescibacteria group bacterium]|jgi:glycosyltransferase involved in cell wall biosynthesis
MKIALVHDYLAQDGGAERVLKAFHEIWPEAPIFVLFHDQEKITGFNEENIRESFLSKFPFVRSNFQWYLPLMPGATERHNLENFDVVLSSSSAFAKGVITSPATLHISYCHTPARYLWSDTHNYIADLPYNKLVKMFLPRLISRLRLWDKMSADRVDHFIANSQTVQYRIQKYYRRESDIIHPPVDFKRFSTAKTLGNYFIAGGRLVPYKNFDLLIRTFNRIGRPLKIFGLGPEFDRLKKIAKPNIEFLGRITDEQKADLLAGALAFVHPQIEDFGITPLEAMASGRPVIAYASGGATETVIPNETGIFFSEQSWESLFEAITHFDQNLWDSEKIRDHAAKFRTENFKSTVENYVNSRFEEFQKGLRQPALLQL